MEVKNEPKGKDVESPTSVIMDSPKPAVSGEAFVHNESPYSKECPEYVKYRTNALTERIKESGTNAILFRVAGNEAAGEKKSMNVVGFGTTHPQIFYPTYSYRDEGTGAYTKTPYLENQISRRCAQSVQARGAWSESLERRSIAATRSGAVMDTVTNSGTITKMDFSVSKQNAFMLYGDEAKKKDKIASKIDKLHDKYTKLLKGKNAGRNRGKEVHKQLEYFIKHGEQRYFRQYPLPHPYVDRVLQELHQLDLVPIASETPIYHPELCIGTKIDIVCMNKSTREMVIVEVKTGRQDSLTLSNGNMTAPFEEFPNNRFNQAFLQIGFSAVMLFRHWNVTCRAAVIFVFEEHSCSFYLGIDVPMLNTMESIQHYETMLFERAKDMGLVGAGSRFHDPNRKSGQGVKRAAPGPALEKVHSNLLKLCSEMKTSGSPKRVKTERKACSPPTVGAVHTLTPEQQERWNRKVETWEKTLRQLKRDGHDASLIESAKVLYRQELQGILQYG